ncbi:Uncharacterized protein Adt_03958 [Abeliophyllum distichum]|uniref:Uncharacterized protein n=1 Tax=Abeliophyllum distichum TaxID=126358 RepID=A0ABD1W0F6_9LAMI
MIRYYGFNFFQSNTRFHENLCFIIPLLVALLELKSQIKNQNANPFDTHPGTMRIAFTSIFLYYLAYHFHLRFSSRIFFSSRSRAIAIAAYHCMLWFGNLAVASLVSIFFLDSIRPMLYASSALLSAAEFLQWGYRRILEDHGGLHVLRRRINQFLISTIGSILPNSFMEQRHILPL